MARFIFSFITLSVLFCWNMGAMAATAEQERIDHERDSIYSKICYASATYHDFVEAGYNSLGEVLKNVGGINIEDYQVTHCNRQVSFIIDGRYYSSAHAWEKYGKYRKIQKSLSDFKEVSRFYPLYTIKKIFFVERQYSHLVQDGTRNSDMIIIITNKYNVYDQSKQR